MSRFSGAARTCVYIVPFRVGEAEQLKEDLKEARETERRVGSLHWQLQITSLSETDGQTDTETEDRRTHRQRDREKDRQRD